MRWCFGFRSHSCIKVHSKKRQNGVGQYTVLYSTSPDIHKINFLRILMHWVGFRHVCKAIFIFWLFYTAQINPNMKDMLKLYHFCRCTMTLWCTNLESTIIPISSTRDTLSHSRWALGLSFRDSLLTSWFFSYWDISAVFSPLTSYNYKMWEAPNF